VLVAILVVDEWWRKGRFAVFVCEKKKPNTCRIALLWRKELDTTESLSTTFGYYINGLKFLAAVVAGKEEAGLLNVKNEKWDYFGPNCTQITTYDHELQVSAKGGSLVLL